MNNAMQSFGLAIMEMDGKLLLVLAPNYFNKTLFCFRRYRWSWRKWPWTADTTTTSRSNTTITSAGAGNAVSSAYTSSSVASRLNPKRESGRSKKPQKT
jgi:hypothetical protein